MKYRVKLDLSFVDEADAQALVAYAKDFLAKADSINEGQDNEEIAFIDYEICRHDDPSSFLEGKGCEKLERIEIRKG